MRLVGVGYAIVKRLEAAMASCVELIGEVGKKSVDTRMWAKRYRVGCE